jgi:hypothetical protein
VWFVNIATRATQEFALEQFLVGGAFPAPAP